MMNYDDIYNPNYDTQIDLDDIYNPNYDTQIDLDEIDNPTNYNTEYVSIDKPDFYDSIRKKKEFSDLKYDTIHDDNTIQYPRYKKSQLFVARFLSSYTPYKELFLYHETGTGKSGAVFATIELIRKTSNTFKRARIYTKNKTLAQNFTDELKRAGILNEDKFYKVGMYSDIHQTPNFENEIIVLDEIHSQITMTGTTEKFEILVTALRNMRDTEKNYKLIAMTATPLRNNVKEMYAIIDLLSSRYGVNVNIDRELKQLKELDGPFENLPILINEIKDKLRGKISYLKFNTNKVKIHKEIIDIHENATEKQISQQHILENLDVKTINKLREKSIKPKFEFVINELKQNKGKNSFIFFPKSVEAGVKPFMKELNEKKNGFIELNNETIKEVTDLINSVVDDDVDYKYYISSVSSVDSVSSVANLLEYLALFNHQKNKNGKFIKFIVGSEIISTGYTFKNIQNIFIMESDYNYTTINQAIGRGLRYQSHDDLLNDSRSDIQVDVYYLRTIYIDENNNKEIFSVDKALYELCDKKQQQFDEIDDVLKQLAVDCFTNKQINNVVSCENFLTEITNTTDIDISTDLAYYFKKSDLYPDIQSEITKLFLHSQEMQLDFLFIYNNISSVQITKTKGQIKDKFKLYVLEVLNDMILYKIILRNRYQRKCILDEYKDNYFLIDYNYFIDGMTSNSQQQNYFLNYYTKQKPNFLDINSILPFKKKDEMVVQVIDDTPQIDVYDSTQRDDNTPENIDDTYNKIFKELYTNR